MALKDIHHIFVKKPKQTSHSTSEINMIQEENTGIKYAKYIKHIGNKH